MSAISRTVLLTGVSGFIAKRIALDLLNAGHTVVGSLRSMGRADEVRDAVAPLLRDKDTLDRLSFVELDLTLDDGWTEAMDGIDVVMHTASPFPLSAPKDEDDLIKPAVDGTLRALQAAHAGGVTRIILTSSVAAIEARDKDGPYSENDWSDTEHPRCTAYYKSKTLAEQAAWRFVTKTPGIELTVINPVLVLGAPLDAHYGSSLEIIERMMGGKDPMVPDIAFGVVDVADISAMHLAAMDRPESIGQRFIGSAASMSMPEVAAHLAKTYPGRKIPTRVAPRFMLRLIGLFDATVGGVIPLLGHKPVFDTAKAQDVLGITFTPAATAIDRAATAVDAKG